MTKDDFRKFQKPFCASASPTKRGIYGCPCCRKLSNLRDFKRMCRKAAKGQFRTETRRLVREGIVYCSSP
jgi:hypothetical protein